VVMDSSSTDPQGATLSYLWMLNDGCGAPVAPSTLTDANPTIDFGDCLSTSIDVQLQVTTSIQNVVATTTQPDIVITAPTPTAAFTSQDNQDGTVTFDATSSDPGGPTVTIADPAGYVWGPAPVAIPNGSNPTNIDFSGLAGPPPFNVTLTVTNNFGQSDPVTESVDVSAIPTALATVTDNSGVLACTLNIVDNGSSSPLSTSISLWNWTFTPDVGPVQNSFAMNPGVVTFNVGTTTVAVDLTVTNNWSDIDSIITINRAVATCP